MMKKKRLRAFWGLRVRGVFALALCLLGLLFASGCVDHAYRPPARPFAGMFPTVLSADMLQKFKPVSISVSELREELVKQGIWSDLQGSGFLESELSMVVRCLGRRGYAEIDCRRCTACRVEWIAFMGGQNGNVNIVTRLSKSQEMLRSLWTPSGEAQRAAEGAEEP